MIIVAFFYKKIYKKKKIVIIFFSIIPPTLAQIIILLFFTKHMAYNINFCEGNLEAVPAWFWFSLRTKQKKTLTLFTHTLPNFNLAKKKNNCASIDPKKYNRHNKNYS